MDVLLVDDSRVMRQLVRRTLRQAGYVVGQVEEAGSAAEALEKLKGFLPDLVLCDWNMPGTTGLQLLAGLRQTGNPVRFGFVTSESTPVMRARATASGASFLLTKPFGPDELRFAMAAAGMEPSGQGVGGAEPPAAASVAAHLDGPLVAKVLEALVHVPVSAKPGPKLVPAVTPCVSTTWIDDEDQLRYCGFCELALAASLGGALGLRPTSWVTEQLRSRAIPDALHADSREVFNVLSRAFNDCSSVHVRLGEITFPPAPPLPAARAFEARAGSRLDLLVTVQGYATGKLSLVSANRPQFVAVR